MENKNLQPLHEDIQIENNQNHPQQNITNQAYQQNDYSNRLAEETNALLRQRLKKEIRDSVRSMRRSMINFGIVFFVLFFFSGLSKSNGAALFFLVCIVLLFPIYFARKKKIINEFMDDKPIK